MSLPADLTGVSGSHPLKPQRSLPGTPVCAPHCPIDLRTSMEEKYKEIAEVKAQSRSLIASRPCGTAPNLVVQDVLRVSEELNPSHDVTHV